MLSALLDEHDFLVHELLLTALFIHFCTCWSGNKLDWLINCSAFATLQSRVPLVSVRLYLRTVIGFRTNLFIMYIKPLFVIIDSRSIIHHSFADNIQLQISAPADKMSKILLSMQSRQSDVKSWASANMLNLIDKKTKFMVVTSKINKHLHSYLLQSKSAVLKFQSNSLWIIYSLYFTVVLLRIHNSPIFFGRDTLNCVVLHLFVHSWIVQKLPHCSLLLLRQELTAATHSCLVLLLMSRPTCKGYRPIQLE